MGGGGGDSDEAKTNKTASARSGNECRRGKRQLTARGGDIAYLVKSAGSAKWGGGGI